MWGEMIMLMVGPIEAGNEHAGDIGNGEGEGEEDPHVTCNEQRSWHEVKKAPGDEDDVLEGTISFDSAFLGGATTSKTNWRWRRSSEAASQPDLLPLGLPQYPDAAEAFYRVSCSN